MTPDSPNDTESDAGGTADVPESERIADVQPQGTWLWVVLSRWLLGAEASLRSHGGRGLRFGLRAFWVVVAIGGIVLLVGPIINKPLSLDDITQSASTVTDRWIARSFAADYHVSRAADGTLATTVEEKIDANFPAGTDESGIQRVLATEYQGHALNPSDITATLDGAPVEVTTSSSPNQLTLTMDGAGQLSGDHAFVLRYTLANLAYAATDTASEQPVDLLEWDVFGPSWPQGFAALDVQVTLPKDIDDRLIRQPRGNLAWTLLSSSEWLSPEPGTSSDEVTYRFTNDQNIPPHAQVWFTMSFQPGTFTMPAPTPLYWVQTLGPVAPLAFLAITLLLAFAARAVAWGDAHGRPWFAWQFAPPKGVSARMAAQIIRSPEAMELAVALQRAQPATTIGTGAARSSAKAKRRQKLIAAAKVARRTGRIGDRPRALTRYLTASERRAQLTEGYRRVPRGFVRDLFIAAPLALTLVQWGLVRQLSQQVVLAVVWWPVVFVLASSVIALIVLFIALSSRPLTRRGALLKQHLLGIGVYAERTQLLERTTTTEKLLPYAVLMAPPREAATEVVHLIETELGEPDVSKLWRTSSFLTWPRLVIRALSLLLVAGAITVVSTIASPSVRSIDYLSYSGDVSGNLYTKVQSLDAAATLTRTEDGHAHLAVSEQLTVSFDDSSSRVPQFAQQWPNTLDGQNLGLHVDAVSVDGKPVPFATQVDANTLLMRTTLTDVLNGSHAVQVDYAVDSAAVRAEQNGQAVERVRWAALLSGWEYNAQWGDDPTINPLRVEFALSDDLADRAQSAGWITLDTASDDASDWPPAVVPFGQAVPTRDASAAAGSEAAASDGAASDGAASEGAASDGAATTETTSSAGGVQTHVLDLKQTPGGGGFPFELTVDDLGASADFPVGTFAGPDAAALGWFTFWAALPSLAHFIVAGLAIVIGLAGTVLGARRAKRAFTPGPVRDLLLWLGPATALVAVILFVWLTIDMPADDFTFVPISLAALAAFILNIASLVLTRGKRRTPVRAPATTKKG